MLNGKYINATLVIYRTMPHTCYSSKDPKNEILTDITNVPLTSSSNDLEATATPLTSLTDPNPETTFEEITSTTTYCPEDNTSEYSPTPDADSNHKTTTTTDVTFETETPNFNNPGKTTTTQNNEPPLYSNNSDKLPDNNAETATDIPSSQYTTPQGNEQTAPSVYPTAKSSSTVNSHLPEGTVSIYDGSSTRSIAAVINYIVLLLVPIIAF